jgi:hypothetical protein
MRKAKIACLGLAAALCASAVFADEVFVQSDSVDVFQGGKGSFPSMTPVVENVPRGTSLTVLGREGSWIKVKTPTTQGYVVASELSPDKPGLNMSLSQIPHGKATVGEGAAAKGLGPKATEYAHGKNLKPEYLDNLIKFRKDLDPALLEKFCVDGKVGPAKP